MKTNRKPVSINFVDDMFSNHFTNFNRHDQIPTNLKENCRTWKTKDIFLAHLRQPLPEAKWSIKQSTRIFIRHYKFEVIRFIVMLNPNIHFIFTKSGTALWISILSSIRYIMSNKNYYSSLFHLNEAIYFTIPAIDLHSCVSTLFHENEGDCAINMRIDKRNFFEKLSNKSC